MKNILKLIFQAIGVLLEQTFSTSFGFSNFFSGEDKFSARFGKETDIASAFNKGFVISVNRKLTRRKSFENLLLCGPTGSGKTQKILLKNLLELNDCSIIINDVSKECFLQTAGHLVKSHEILTLNFSDCAQSAGYNPLSRIKKPNDINKIAHILVSATLDKGNGGDPFWSLQSQTIIEIFIRLVLYQKKELRNMATVLHILKTFAISPKKVEAWVQSSKDPKLELDYKALASIPEKTLQNIVASAKAALKIFEDDQIAKVTSNDTISFERLRDNPTVLFLHNSVADQKYVSSLSGIFFEQLYNHILQKLPESKELDLFILLEEASSTYVPVLPIAMANTRKHRVGNLVCIQSPNQLQALYKTEAQNIVANCVTKLYLPGQSSIELLRDIETYSGKATFKDKKGGERVRSLITIDEIRRLKDNQSLILSGNTPIILGKTSPIYKSFKYRNVLNLTPPQIIGICNPPETQTHEN